MKRISYIFAAVLSFMLVSCKQESVRVYDHTAAQDAVGVYEGTWQSISSYSGDTTINTGTVEFVVFKDTLANQCFVYVESAAFGNSRLRGLANVAHAGDDIVFNNDKASGNGLGSAFYGRINGDGTATMSFSSSGKEGRKTVILTNSFYGTKK